MTATLSAPTREVTPLTLDEERTAHDLLDSLPPSACEWRISYNDGPVETCSEPRSWLLLLSCGHSFGYCEEHKTFLEVSLDARGIVCSAKGHAKTRVTHEWRPLDV